MSSADPPSSLALWLARHRAGDPDAQNGILRHTQDRLRALTRQMLRDFPAVGRWEETSDVFQNVLVRLNRALWDLTFGEPVDFLRLAACQVRRELIDLSRKRHLILPPAGGSDPNPFDRRPDPTDDPYHLAVWDEVHTWIDGLPDDDRRLFDLIYYQDLTQDEAAGLLGVSSRTLRRRWQDLRVRFVRFFGDNPF